MTQPQTQQQNNQPSKPVIGDNKPEAAKPAADTSAPKPADAEKTGVA